ncbi:MAG: hypothetical protein R2845_11815 [Thermomicrobiales bacterium]
MNREFEQARKREERKQASDSSRDPDSFGEILTDYARTREGKKVIRGLLDTVGSRLSKGF